MSHLVSKQVRLSHFRLFSSLFLFSILSLVLFVILNVCIYISICILYLYIKYIYYQEKKTSYASSALYGGTFDLCSTHLTQYMLYNDIYSRLRMHIMYLITTLLDCCVCSFEISLQDNIF